MQNEPFIIERTYNAPVEKVWKALTDKDEMKKWYFSLDAFKPEIGFEFRFEGGSKEKTYMHICRVTQLVPGKKISYTWQYEGYDGISEVSFELFPEGKQTRLKLTHTGIDSFPSNIPDFARESFAKGWTYIIGESLAKYLA